MNVNDNQKGLRGRGRQHGPSISLSLPIMAIKLPARMWFGNAEEG